MGACGGGRPVELGEDDDDDGCHAGRDEDHAREGAAEQHEVEDDLDGPDGNGNDEEDEGARERDAHPVVEEVALGRACSASRAQVRVAASDRAAAECQDALRGSVPFSSPRMSTTRTQ